MLFAIGALFCAGYVIRRLVNRRGRREIWWICGTIAPAAAVGSGVILASEHVINTHVAMNVSVLMVWLTDIFGGWMWLTFWHAVRYPTPSRRAMLAHVLVAAAAALVVTALWLAAPIHQISYPGFRDIPLSPEYVLATAVFVIFTICVGSVAQRDAWSIYRQARPSSAPLRGMLLLTVPSTASILVGAVLYFTWLPTRYFSTPTAADRVLNLSQLCSVVAMAIIGIAGVPLMAGTQVVDLVRAIRLVRDLTPLWLRVRGLHPSIALPAAALPRRPTLRAQRIMIEISDALRLIRVAPATDPVLATAAAVATPLPQGAGQPADSILPTPGSFLDEVALVRRIASAYRQLDAVANPAWDRPGPERSIAA